MKSKNKLAIVSLAILLISVISSTSDNAEAQVILSRKCCDNNGYVRCILVDWTPVGNPCFCYGQGYGTTC